MLPRTAAQVLMPTDGAFKTHTSLRETLNQADLDLPYFRTTEQNSPGLMQFANRNPPEPPYTRKLMSPANQYLSDNAFYKAKKEPQNHSKFCGSQLGRICNLNIVN